MLTSDVRPSWQKTKKKTKNGGWRRKKRCTEEKVQEKDQRSIVGIETER